MHAHAAVDRSNAPLGVVRSVGKSNAEALETVDVQAQEMVNPPDIVDSPDMAKLRVVEDNIALEEAEKHGTLAMDQLPISLREDCTPALDLS
jgi:hypothetical protein